MNEFELGQVVCTRGIAEAMKKDRNLYLFILDALYGKYCKCDWGDTCEEDVRSNNEAVKNGERILAAYMYGDTKIWIITEWDRSATTILFQKNMMEGHEKKIFHKFIPMLSINRKFLANVAKIIGITVTDNTVYDCRKIRVTVPVQNCIFAYYKENGFSNAAISCNWLMRGPKADLTGDDLAFEVEDGFTSESGDLCAH